MARKLTLNQQRQANYTRLRYLGFTRQEATDLVSTQRVLKSGRVINVPLLDLNVPFIRTMMKSRARAWERAKRAGISRIKFEKRIKEQYKKGMLVIRNDTRVRVPINDVWDIVRVYEERFTDKHPEYYKEKKKQKTPVTDEDVSRGRKKLATPVRISVEQFTYLDSIGLAGRFKPIYEGEKIVGYQR